MQVDVEDECTFAELRDFVERSFRQVARTRGSSSTSSSTRACAAAIYTDAQRLQQVLKNLLSNAFKFTERGQVTLAIGRATERLELGSSERSHGADAGRRVRGQRHRASASRRTSSRSSSRRSSRRTARRAASTAAPGSASRSAARSRASSAARSRSTVDAGRRAARSRCTCRARLVPRPTRGRTRRAPADAAVGGPCRGPRPACRRRADVLRSRWRQDRRRSRGDRAGRSRPADRRGRPDVRARSSLGLGARARLQGVVVASAATRRSRWRASCVPDAITLDLQLPTWTAGRCSIG